jgi:acetolactate synthase small subunit
MTHFLVVSRNRPGVLARVASVVSASGTNIDTATAYPIGDSDLSVLHLRVSADGLDSDRFRRKLLRLVDVIEVRTGEETGQLGIDLGQLISLTRPLARQAVQGE